MIFIPDLYQFLRIFSCGMAENTLKIYIANQIEILNGIM